MYVVSSAHQYHVGLKVQRTLIDTLTNHSHMTRLYTT